MPDLEAEIVEAVLDGNVEFVHRNLKANVRLVPGVHYGATWLGHVADQDSVEMVKMLIALGCDADEESSNDTSRRPLEDAVGAGRIGIAKVLLENGADAAKGIPVISAIIADNANSLELVKLLVDHGADIHIVYPFGENLTPMNALKMSAVWGKTEVADYLRLLGARMPEDYSPDELKKYLPSDGSWSFAAVSESTTVPADETIAYFRDHFGPVDPLSLIEIVPSEPQVTVHFIPADESRKQVTLFTTGLANFVMNVTANQSEADDFCRAELFLQLPNDWKYRDYEDPQYGWPVHWLRKIAQDSAAENEWLGGPVTIYEAGKPLGPGLVFDSWLLMAERKYQASDGRTIQLYRLTPLYPEERGLEKRNGIGALLRAFDEHSTPFVIDLKRKNAAV